MELNIPVYDPPLLNEITALNAMLLFYLLGSKYRACPVRFLPL